MQLTLLFQFYKVRLKLPWWAGVVIALCIFQFYKVRLKLVMGKSMVLRLWNNFNSTKFD